MQRILGIDPGLVCTGYAVIESDGRVGRLVHCDSVRSRTGGLAPRLQAIFEQLSMVLKEYQPDTAAIENVFFAKDAVAALKLGQARGVAVCAAAVAGVPVFEYSSRSVKKSVVGYGTAGKEQVVYMVARILQVAERACFDEADAIAIALCHAFSTVNKTSTQLAQLARREAGG